LVRGGGRQVIKAVMQSMKSHVSSDSGETSKQGFASASTAGGLAAMDPWAAGA